MASDQNESHFLVALCRKRRGIPGNSSFFQYNCHFTEDLIVSPSVIFLELGLFYILLGYVLMCQFLYTTKKLVLHYTIGIYSVRSQGRHHHHHHVVPLARISLTLSRHFSLSFIASGRSSGLHSVFSHSC